MTDPKIYRPCDGVLNPFTLRIVEKDGRVGRQLQKMTLDKAQSILIDTIKGTDIELEDLPMDQFIAFFEDKDEQIKTQRQRNNRRARRLGKKEYGVSKTKPSGGAPAPKPKKKKSPVAKRATAPVSPPPSPGPKAAPAKRPKEPKKRGRPRAERTIKLRLPADLNDLEGGVYPPAQPFVYINMNVMSDEYALKIESEERTFSEREIQQLIDDRVEELSDVNNKDFGTAEYEEEIREEFASELDDFELELRDYEETVEEGVLGSGKMIHQFTPESPGKLKKKLERADVYRVGNIDGLEDLTNEKLITSQQLKELQDSLKEPENAKSYYPGDKPRFTILTPDLVFEKGDELKGEKKEASFRDWGVTGGKLDPRALKAAKVKKYGKFNKAQVEPIYPVMKKDWDNPTIGGVPNGVNLDDWIVESTELGFFHYKTNPIVYLAKDGTWRFVALKEKIPAAPFDADEEDKDKMIKFYSDNLKVLTYQRDTDRGRRAGDIYFTLKYGKRIFNRILFTKPNKPKIVSNTEAGIITGVPYRDSDIKSMADVAKFKYTDDRRKVYREASDGSGGFDAYGLSDLFKFINVKTMASKDNDKVDWGEHINV
jgi:hypothetical protein